jgi:Raf kinase inhibitor-like YbhB/YbcL family protein
MRLTSPAFSDGGPIPRRHGFRAGNVTPPLVVEDLPRETVTIALVVDDPDAVDATGTVWDHWVVWNVPVEASTRSIPEDWEPTTAGASVGVNDFGEHGYGGPNPPDRPHTYRFVAYALDAELDLPSGATKEELEAAMEDRVVAEARLEGTYAPA